MAIKNAWPSIVTYFNDTTGLSTLTLANRLLFHGRWRCRDKDGFYWILGRVDDVVNVSGPALSTAEIEAALIEHEMVGESAVVGYADDLTGGQAVAAYVSLKSQF